VVGRPGHFRYLRRPRRHRRRPQPAQTSNLDALSADGSKPRDFRADPSDLARGRAACSFEPVNGGRQLPVAGMRLPQKPSNALTFPRSPLFQPVDGGGAGLIGRASTANRGHFARASKLIKTPACRDLLTVPSRGGPSVQLGSESLGAGAGRHRWAYVGLRHVQARTPPLSPEQGCSACPLSTSPFAPPQQWPL
jgi:hypothetical protein